MLTKNEKLYILKCSEQSCRHVRQLCSKKEITGEKHRLFSEKGLKL